MTWQDVDVFIAGGGPAGLIGAAAFAHAGFSVCLADPYAPVTDGGAQGADLRSTAFLQPAQDLFEAIGLWPELAPDAVPLRTLRIVDTAGDPPQVRGERAFRSAELGALPFGWNFMNWQIRRVLVDHLRRQTNVELRFGAGFDTMLTRRAAALVTLDDGARIRARLVIGADGRNSAVREAAGISVRTTRYGQKSLAFVATHPVPHNEVSTEIYHQGGPFTMVPLKDVDATPASAIVWMNPGARAMDLLAMEPDALNAAMTRRSAGLFGPLQLEGRRGVFPIITQTARRLTAERTAIVAEAAHVLPPIGAQGLNTSLNDIAALLQAAGDDTRDLGSADMLARYERARSLDIAARAHAIDLFNRVTRSGNPFLQGLRLAGLKVAHDVAPLRRGLVRAGLGPL